jgi:hypothetical protein
MTTFRCLSISTAAKRRSASSHDDSARHRLLRAAPKWCGVWRRSSGMNSTHHEQFRYALRTSNFSIQTSSIHSRDPLRSASLRATLTLEDSRMASVNKLAQQLPNNPQLSWRVVPADVWWCGEALRGAVQSGGESSFQLRAPSLQKAKKRLIATVANSEIDVCPSKNRTSQFLIATKNVLRRLVPFAGRSPLLTHQSPQHF